MARRRKKIVVEEEIDDGRSPRRKRRFLRRLIVLGVLLMGLVAVAPLLIAHSPLRETLLNWQMPVGGWRIACSQAQLSWTGSQSLGNVVIADPAGHPLCTAESFEVQRSLLGLIASSHDLGVLRFVRPTLHVIARPDGSNIGDFTAAIAKQQRLANGSDTAIAKSPRQARVEIVDGALRGSDTATGRQWYLVQINLTARQGPDSGLVTADGTAVVANKNNEAVGRVKLRALPTDDGRQQVDALGEGLLLDALLPWLRSVVDDAHLAGSATVDGHAIWAEAGDGKLDLETWGRLEASGVELAGAVLQGDRLHAEKLTVPWKVTLQDDLLTAEEFKIDCGWADLELAGSLALAEVEQLSLSQLPRRELNITGHVALAQLAAMLPNTLQIRDGVRIDAGNLRVTAKIDKPADKFTWTGNAQLANVVGRDGGRIVQWEEPVDLTAIWVEGQLGTRLDRVRFVAPFAQGDFTTNENRISGEFQLDLAQLTTEVGQFFDLRGLACQGRATGNLTLTASEGDAFAATADVALDRFAVSRDAQPIWEEPQLTVKLEGVGSAAGVTPKSLSTGSLELRGPRDQCRLNLIAPVDFTKPEVWSVAIDGTGPVDSWAGRLRLWLDGIPAEMTGDAVLTGNAKVSPSAVQITDLKGTVDKLRVRSGAVAVDEPHVEFSGDCAWDTVQRKFSSQQLQLASSVVAFRSRDLRFEFPGGAVPLMTGDLAFRTDLERFVGGAGLIRQGAAWPRGSASGVMRFATNSEQVLADFTFDVEQLQLVKPGGAGPPQVVWSEPQLHSAGKVVYSIAAERAGIDKFQLDGQTMQLAGDLQWDKPLANGPIDIAGNLQYDPAALSGLIANYVGPGVTVQGDRIVRFEARGTLADSGERRHWSRTWQGTAEAGWTSAAAFGLPISAARLQGTLGNGQLRFAPLDVSVGAGRLTANALGVFDPTPQRVVIPAGPLIANVQVSPAVSEQMLKYVAPVLAGATRVDGQFSLDMKETQVLLADPRQTRAAGKLAVHQLTVMPGPLLADIVNVIQQVQSLKNPENLLGSIAAPKPTKLLSMDDQQIEFQVVDGRVYHRQLEFIIDDVPIRSQGSVGFDQTLALEISIPIQDRWIDGEDALQGLAGQTLKIPIQGTFQNPRVDQRALADITRQLIRNTAGQAIGNEINRQLEKLLRGK